jgi:hypothetical protein
VGANAMNPRARMPARLPTEFPVVGMREEHLRRETKTMGATMWVLT